jgi:hypothetical protein
MKGHAMKNTSPGPWHVDTSNGEFKLVASDGQTVFLIGDDRMLITAAPALYAALSGLLEYVDAISTPGDNVEKKAARAALSLAQGGGK